MLTTVKLKRDCKINDWHSTNFYKKGTEFYLTEKEIIELKEKWFI